MAKSAAVIRGLFGSMTDPETISFGGGAPAKEALPIDAVREITNEVITMDKRGVEALQYGPIMGVRDLREVVVEQLLAPKGVKTRFENVMITSGGLETMNLLCQLFIDPGDVILVESPTFVHCVEIFEMFQARCVACACDADGLVMEDVEAKIKQYHPKMVYVIPTFQNPTGRTLTLERRKKLAQLGSEYDVYILEDDPYRDIRYSGAEVPPIKSFDATGHVILANSFSKIFSPGSRLGYVVANDEIMPLLSDAKSATNSHTSMLPQVICAEFFKRGYFPEHLKKVCALYRERRDVMMKCLDELFPEGTKHTFPDGGLFTWAELPGGIDTAQLLPEANAHKVAYVAGAGFFTEPGKGGNCMRLSFGGVQPDKIRVGMQRLADLVAAKMPLRA